MNVPPPSQILPPTPLCRYDAATWHTANAIASASDAPPVFVYKFTEKVPQNAIPCEPCSAWHGCDTTFWNAEEPIRPKCCAAHAHPRPAATELGRSMAQYLETFCRNGDPNSPGLPAWEAHSLSRPGRYMELGRSIGMRSLEPSDAERHTFFSKEFFGKRLKAELLRAK